MAHVDFNFLSDDIYGDAKSIRADLLRGSLLPENLIFDQLQQLQYLYRAATYRTEFELADVSLRISCQPDDSQLSARQAALEKRLTSINSEIQQLPLVSGEPFSLFRDFSPPPPPIVDNSGSNSNLNENSMEIDNSSRNKKRKEPNSENNSENWQKVTKKSAKNKKNDSDKPSAVTVNQTSDSNIKKVKIPPFFIEPIKAWANLMASISRIAPSARGEMKNKWIRIQVDTELEYRAVQGFLTREQIYYRSFLLDSQKNQKLILRGLPASTKIDDIKYCLKHVEILSIQQLNRGNSKNKIPLPLFMIQFPRLADLSEIHQITSIMGLKVQFEKYRGRKGPQQCHRCQGFFHSAAACALRKACVRCAKEHSSSDCTKPFEDPCTCANCGADHPANYRLCPKFPGNVDSKNVKTLAKATTSKIVRSAPSRKVDNALSYARAATNAVATDPPNTINDGIQIKSAPQKGAHSDADFLSQILKFEETFGKKVVLQVFEKSLPELRKTPSEVDRIFIIYRNLPSLSG